MYEPPDPGIAAPSSLQIMPSEMVHQGNEPAEHRLWPTERREQERNRNERPDADHVCHVERRGLEQAEASQQVRLFFAVCWSSAHCCSLLVACKVETERQRRAI